MGAEADLENIIVGHLDLEHLEMYVRVTRKMMVVEEGKSYVV